MTLILVTKANYKGNKQEVRGFYSVMRVLLGEGGMDDLVLVDYDSRNYLKEVSI